MLAQMLARLGYGVVVIDCFSDIDTQQVTRECIQVDELNVEAVKVAFFDIRQRYNLSFAIVGSGFESHLSSLEYLHQNISVLGNSTAIFTRIQHKENFFSTLDRLDIPYPEVAFQVPKTDGSWLLKPSQGEGGLDIKRQWALLEKSPAYYWQRFIDGEAMSVLFIANESGFNICGFHRQQVESIGGHDFIFSGVMTQPELRNSIKKKVEGWVAKLVVEYDLKGINTLDFMLKDGHCYALEVNPRPSASMQLYDDAVVISHINSCLHQPFSVPAHSKEYRAYQIIYADTDVRVGKCIEWPEWVVDIPSAESLIFTGMPICSIIARGKSEQQVVDTLLLRRQTVKQLL
jgi:predicted ATP-grasp superfamily ATP-dependent carboligase